VINYLVYYLTNISYFKVFASIFIVVFVVPFGVNFDGILDLAAVRTHSGELDPGVGSSVAVNEHSEALFDHFARLFFAALLGPVVADDGFIEVG
jgi:hypothetical protein